jgi:hypothetical protein
MLKTVKQYDKIGKPNDCILPSPNSELYSFAYNTEIGKLKQFKCNSKLRNQGLKKWRGHRWLNYNKQANPGRSYGAPSS